jgi:hypothetical protein
MKTTITRDQWIRIGKTAGWLPLEKNAGFLDYIWPSPQAKELNKMNLEDAIIRVMETSDENMLLAAIKHKDKKIREAAANNPAASDKVLTNAVKKGESYLVVRAALGNQKVTSEIVAAAFNNKHYEAAVTHNQAPEKILLQALDMANESGSRNARLAQLAASNKSATKDVLLKAVTNRNPDVRNSALWNENADYDVKYAYVKFIFVGYMQLDLRRNWEEEERQRILNNLIIDIRGQAPRYLAKLRESISNISDDTKLRDNALQRVDISEKRI